MVETDGASKYGTVSLSPDGDVVAGTYGTWTITYTVGALGMDDGGTLKVAIHQTSDWGKSQFEDPRADNYASVETTGDADVSGTFDPDGHVRSYRHTVTVRVTDGSLEPGERITLTMGDTSGGSMGQRAQTFVEEDLTFKVLVDPHKTGDFLPLPEEPSLDVVPGRAESVVSALPSTVEPGEEVALSVRAEDYWGNVATGYSGTLDVDLPENAEGPAAVELESGSGETTVSFSEPGVYRVTVRDEGERRDAIGRGVSHTSNPCYCDDGTELTTFWGDIHGQSRETVGHRSVREYFDHLSEHAFLDFGSHAGNDFQITDEFWEELRATVREFHRPGEFVTFLCYEWSATTALGGDHNVYFLDNDEAVFRSSNWLTEDGDGKFEGLRPVSELYEYYEGRDDVLIIPHQGGRPATLDVLDPDLTPFIEIASVWGVFEWFAEEALEGEHRVGFVGGSDDHCGRPGTAPPDELAKHNVNGGLMAAKAPDLDRESLWESFNDRRVYATTGDRILLDVDVDGAKMGEETSLSSPFEISVSTHGTAPIREIDLFRGTDLIATESFVDGDDLVEVRWSGQRTPVRSRDKVIDWSGGASVDAGRINRVETFGIHHPEQGIDYVGDTFVEWEAYTTGNYQGIRMDIDAPDGSELAVSTPPASETVELGTFDEVEREAEGENAALRIGRTGTATELDVEATFREDPAPGSHPYFVRVTQDDGGMAWSSSIFVSVEE